MSQALYRKWRPARFTDVIGQEHVTRTLQNSVAAARVGHAYLFCGPRGTGKTTSARLLAKAVNCLDPDLAKRPCNRCAICLAVNQGRFLDLIEIDAASNTGVDDIRDLRDKINFAPSEGSFKVYIIDEVHMLSTAAFNALLKTLEEPPPHAKFVLATTEEHKVPLTIKSRCQQFNFRLLSLQEIIDRLTWLAEKEDLELEPEARLLIAQHGAGSLRDAESLLDQLVGIPGETITLKQTQAVLGTAASQSVAALTDAIFTQDSATGLAVIHEALSVGADARQFSRQMVAYLRHLLLLQTGGEEIVLDVTAEQREKLLAQTQQAPRSLVIHAIKQFNEAATATTTSWQPQLPLELAFLESLRLQEERDGSPAPRVTVAQPSAPAAKTPSSSAPPLPPPSLSEETGEPAAVTVTATQSEPEGAPEPIPQPAAATSDLSLADIKGKIWRQFVARAGDTNRNLKNWLNSSQPLGVEGNMVVIGFDLPFLKTKLESEIDTASRAMSDVLKQEVRIRCVMKSDYTPPPVASSGGGQKKNLRAEVEAFAKEVGGIVRDTSDTINNE